MFSATAASASLRPAGLLNGLSPITPATAGGSDLETALTDVGSLAAAIAEAGINPAGMIIVAAWPQAVKLMGLAGNNFNNLIIGTDALPDTTVVGIAPAGVASAYSGVPQIETSREALAHFEDTTPLPIATGTQGSGVLATPTRSAWQTNMIIIRVKCRCAWIAQPSSIQWLDSVNW